MTEKQKHQHRMHPLIFLAGWTGILILGWIFAILGFLEISWFLPYEVRHLIRETLSIEFRQSIRTIALIIMGLSIPIAQRYLLNRAFGIHLSWWWIALTFFGYVAGFYVSLWIVWSLPKYLWNTPALFSDVLWWIVGVLIMMGIPASLQWGMLHRFWHHAWIWIIASVISGYVIFLFVYRFTYGFDLGWTYLTYNDAIKMIPSGLAHGLLTGVTALGLNKFAQRPYEKSKPQYSDEILA